jgi:glycerophosphoryl diester phosphodiesterase
MRDALKSFVLSVFGVLFLAGIGWLILNNVAASKPEPHPFPHPFLDALEKGPRPLAISYRGNTSVAPPNTIEAFKAAAPTSILWVDARPTGEGVWLAMTEKTLPGDRRQWVSYMHDADVMKADAGYEFTPDGGKTFPFRGKGFRFATLTEVLKAFPERMFVINFQDYKAGGMTQIIQLIKDAKAGERSLISSPEDGILRDLREAEPTWVFGTSRAQVTRLLMLSQLFLAGSAPIRGDVFVLDPEIPLHRLNDGAWAEVQRRKMKSVIAIDGAPKELGDLWRKRADAIVESNR